MPEENKVPREELPSREGRKQESSQKKRCGSWSQRSEKMFSHETQRAPGGPGTFSSTGRGRLHLGSAHPGGSGGGTSIRPGGGWGTCRKVEVRIQGQEAPGVSEGRYSREDPREAAMRALVPHGGRKTRLGRNELPTDSRHPEPPRGWVGDGAGGPGPGDLGGYWAGRPDVSAASARGQSRMSHCGRR